MGSHQKSFRHKVRHNLKATILKLDVTQRSNFMTKVILYSPYQALFISCSSAKKD